MTTPDSELLQQFARDRSEKVFATLVSRHVDLVYSAALRQVRSPQLAEDVAQTVFIDLSRNADKLASDTILTAWLYRVTRRAAIDVVRSESRRQLREQIAVELADMNSPDTHWKQIEPLLEEAMETLDEQDRSSILLRYFENKSLREVGETLGTSDDAAQKRVSRAVERLRDYFSKSGIAVGASGLIVVISANAIQAAPVGLSAVLVGASITAGSSIAQTFVTTMNWIKIKSVTAIFASAIVAGTGMYLFQQVEIIRLRDENRSLKIPKDERAEKADKILPSTIETVGDLERARKEKSELIRLRGEVGVLRQKTNELEILRAASAMAKASIAIVQTNVTAPPTELFTRTFKVGTNSFLTNLRTFARPLDGETPSQIMHRYLKEVGIELEPPSALFINETNGLLMIRTSLTNLEGIQPVVEFLGIGR